MQATGVSDGFCFDYCQTLFDKCGHEYLDPYISSEEGLPFCRQDSLICAKASDYVESAADFCKLIGFKPSLSGMQYSTKSIGYTDCFDGTPSVGRGGPANGFKYDKVKRTEKQD